MTPRYHRHDEPLTSEDLSKCKLILEEFCTANNVALTSDEAERVAAIIIELYQQGVHELHHLRPLVDAARGNLADDAPPAQGLTG
ncbi:hypothetical protein QO004_004251 [Rhizobium mesoamericanum]|uniref:hypothetical protein n=1 Tax=Rhizobium mesoamericanum TaxID=1079800 RepID=UPI0027829A82|nr:hypothetical protein [Rhizobium mesoamericanum]MDQ0562446.1 hypothetical protein [Rhizobium mesoamericanum]